MEQILETFKSIWNDPVWAAVISGIILFFIGVGVKFLFSSKEANDREGGKGGNAKVIGKNSGAIGGTGGKGGIIPGGDGGHAEVIGDYSFARGGDGGNAGQYDGRGGRRTLSQGENLNMPTQIWPFGYGGAGGNHPEYDRRLSILKQIRKEYMAVFPDDVIFIEAGIDIVPIRWVNKRLEEMKENWQVSINSLEGGYQMPKLDATELIPK